MLQELQGPPANPSSVHTLGQRARSLLLSARSTVARAFSFAPDELLFTSGGTEALNLLLKSIPSPIPLITSTIEHSSVYKTAQALAAQGKTVHFLRPTPLGFIAPDTLAEALERHPGPCAIVLGTANSETGVKNDWRQHAHIASRAGAYLFLDATASVGKEPLPLPPTVAGVAFSAHKFHGPKGVGALLFRAPFPLFPQFTGGAQEKSRRAGTENLAGILGLAAALERASGGRLLEIEAHLRALSERFETLLQAALPRIRVNGQGAPRVGNVSNILFPGADGEALLFQLDQAGVAASLGSACASGALEPSRVLLEMGLSPKEARSSIRFSFSRFNTLEEIEQAALLLIQQVNPRPASTAPFSLHASSVPPPPPAKIPH